ncbi:hypothetical protein BU26DRAFT_595094 [Trematosphaeria pertusa]|uniref:Uncharacterized protein n=1 Tax=Trematosphaeria pertusa TaxID=390896 RepID=A0A6A6IHG1_9PLEO|nr:uncharacterized protein BU26DRAFT_595094 [Trematosphaeria pertusa]KAF2249322.1 hypothetical protein BU26DRAFT_595094 [Trematosphaeria pertusa]
MSALVHAELTPNVPQPAILTKAVRLLRMSEVFELGRRMCEANLGTPAAIKRLVEQRLQEITSDEEAGCSNTPAKESKGSISTPQPVYYKETARKSNSEPSRSPVDEAASTNASDEGDAPSTFSEARADLQDALTAYCIEYASDQNCADYKEITQAFTAGINEAAARPRKSQSPQKLWKEVSTSVLASAEKERLRRERVVLASAEKERLQRESGARARATSILKRGCTLGSVAQSDGGPGLDLDTDFEAGESDDDGYESPTPSAAIYRKRKRESFLGSVAEKQLVVPAGKRLRVKTYQSAVGEAQFNASVQFPPNQQSPAPLSTPSSHSMTTQQPLQVHTPQGCANPTAAGKQLTGNSHKAGFLQRTSMPSPPATGGRFQEPRSYNFSSPALNGVPLRDTPAVMQSFFRNTVEEVLENILENTESDETRGVVHAYWKHIGEEVPR